MLDLTTFAPGAAELVAPSAHEVRCSCDLRGDVRLLGSERAQDVGVGGDPLSLCLEVGDPPDVTLPVERRPVVPFGDDGELFELLGKLASARFQLSDRFAERRARLVQLGGVLDERLDLSLVAPAEHVLATFVDAPAVVLLVPVTRLHLPFAGDRLVGAAEVAHRFNARMVGAVTQLVAKPRLELAARLDLYEVDQQREARRAIGCSRRNQTRRNSVVDEASAEMS